MRKRILAIVVVLILVVGFAFSAYATSISGTITQIDGSKVTVKKADGKEVTVELKLGDRITIRQTGKKDKEKDKEVTPAPKKKKAVEGC